MGNNYDLKISWNDCYGSHLMEYLRIFDFTDHYESGTFSDIESSATNVSVKLFDKECNTHKFSTIKEVYDFACDIMK
jgi:hypothetical protein